MILNFRRIWQYALTVAVLMVTIGIAISSNDVATYKSRVAAYLSEGNYAKALEVGQRSDKSDRQLMLLRMKALHHEHLLGERLFTYPIIGAGRPLVSKGGDYELCAYLIDKDLKKFAAALPKYYAINEQLPRHYREALVCYNRKHSDCVIVFHDAVMETDYEDMQQQKRGYKDAKARQVALARNYEGTYWYYFDFLNNEIGK